MFIGRIAIPDLPVEAEVIERIVDRDDYSILLGYLIIERHPHPTERGSCQTIEDIYTATERTRIIRQEGGAPVGEPQVFPNLIGRIPIVHIANNRSADEYYGTPELEATIELLQQYGEVIAAAISGNIRQGRPTPAIDFKDEESLAAYWDEYATTVCPMAAQRPMTPSNSRQMN